MANAVAMIIATACDLAETKVWPKNTNAKEKRIDLAKVGMQVYTQSVDVSNLSGSIFYIKDAAKTLAKQG